VAITIALINVHHVIIISILLQLNHHHLLIFFVEVDEYSYLLLVLLLSPSMLSVLFSFNPVCLLHLSKLKPQLIIKLSLEIICSIDVFTLNPDSYDVSILQQEGHLPQICLACFELDLLLLLLSDLLSALFLWVEPLPLKVVGHILGDAYLLAFIQE
jgi:hypothetical protein